MKPVLTHPTYDQLHQGVANIALQLAAGLMPDYIIGLTRGGLIPAVIMSHMLDDTTVIPVSYSSTEGNGDNRNHSNTLPTINPPMHSGLGEMPKLPHLLIIDDICDSGRTMKEVANHYINTGHLVTTASLYYKQSSAFKPDHYWQSIPEDSPWIIFPFE